MTHPVISVVVPTFNRAHVVERALRSIDAQTLSGSEVIVVDDGSTDRTPELLDRYVRQSVNPRRCIRIDRNRGAAHARNVGVAAATGDLVAFLDADDEWQPEKLAVQLRAFEQAPPSVGVITTAYHLVDRNGRSRGTHPGDPKDGDLSACALDFVSGQREIAGVFSTLMFRRELFSEAGGLDETLSCWEDADFYCRVAARAHFAFIPAALTTKHESQDSISFNWSREAAGVSRFWQKYRDRFGSTPAFRRHLAWHQHSVGIEACKAGEVGQGRRLFRESLTIWPYDVRPFVHFAASLAGPAAYSAMWSRR